MTEQHPLTDDLAENIAPMAQWVGDIGDTIFRHCDMRAAYDLAIDYFSDWIRENGHEYVSYHHELGAQSDFERMIADFNQTMRPQENN